MSYRPSSIAGLMHGAVSNDAGAKCESRRLGTSNMRDDFHDAVLLCQRDMMLYSPEPY